MESTLLTHIFNQMDLRQRHIGFNHLENIIPQPIDKIKASQFGTRHL